MNKRGGVDGARNLINGGKHPENIGDDYAVYVNNNQSATPSIIGYRSNDKWYNAYGVEISDPAVLKTENGGTDPSPYLTPEGKTRDLMKFVCLANGDRTAKDFFAVEGNSQPSAMRESDIDLMTSA